MDIDQWKGCKRFDDEDGVIVCRDRDLIEIIAEEARLTLLYLRLAAI